MNSQVPTADVVVVGSFVQDLAFYAETFPKPGESRIGRFAPGPGGKGFNQAIASHRLGASTLFVGAVGADSFGESARTFAAEQGMPVDLVVCEDQRSGVSSIVVDASAQNIIVVDLGANRALPPSEIDARHEMLASSRVVLCQAESNLAATARALKQGREAGATTVLNPAPINDEVDASLISLADVVTPNETEFAFLMAHLRGRTLADEYWLSSDEEVHAWCGELGSPTVVLTLGDQGCFVSHHRAHATGGHRFLGSDESPWARVHAADVHAVDTTGAGDAFSGALAAGLASAEGDFLAAVRFANTAAGLSTTQPGTAPAMPNRGAVEAFLAR